MDYLRNSNFTNSVKGKVIIAFCVGLLALILAWVVSKVAFRKMMDTVETIAVPDKKLRIVNNLFRDITKLDQVQRAEAFQRTHISFKSFLKQSDSLRYTMDSLRVLYASEPLQVRRIEEMKDLLKERDSLFVSYLKEREGLVNGRELKSQLHSLSGLIDKSSSQIDSTIVTTEQKFSTTTVVPKDKNEDDRGFLSKIFGGRKKNGKKGQNVVKEEVSITVDTLARANSDSVIQAMEKAVKNLEKRQRQRSSRFVNREAELTNAGNILINEMLAVLQQVEREAIRQADRNSSKAREVVNGSISGIEIIMLGFILITAFFVYLILSDISRSNAYREELEAARDEAEYHGMAKQRFLSSMSHEIRTPLQSIIGYAEQIRDQEQPDKKNVNAIYHSALHLLHIVNEILDYSRIVSGKFRFTRSVFSMNKLLEEVITVMKPQAEKKKLGLVLRNQAEDAEFVIGDPFRLKQILFNLLGNAIKFTDEGEVLLTVSSRVLKRKCYLTFEVSDTGKGIPYNELKNIFGEFEQVHDHEASVSNGTGLGLSIVKALTEGQGGTIDVKSEPGRGSTFTVKLKYVIAKEAASGQKDTAGLADRFKGEVWIIDDDRFILDLCSSLLKKHGIKHRCFEDPHDVLASVAGEDLKLVLTDMRMPGMDGNELCRKLKKQLDPAVKIYALTAQVLPDERQELLNEGFDGLLMKPFREQDLLALLKSISSLPIPRGKKERKLQEVPALLKMTGGDRDLLQKILTRFEEDTTKDIISLRSAMKEVNINDIALLLHRIAGRTAQVGIGGVAAKFREEELIIRKSMILSPEQEARIHSHIEEINNLILQSDTFPSYYTE